MIEDMYSFKIKIYENFYHDFNEFIENGLDAWTFFPTVLLSITHVHCIRRTTKYMSHTDVYWFLLETCHMIINGCTE